jgi:hypothetical protein
MNDFQLKKLIGKLTGVTLVREAMADFANVPPIAKRDISWSRHFGGAMPDVPEAVTAVFNRKIESYKNEFVESTGIKFNGERLVYAYFGKDPIMAESQMKTAQTDPRYKELLDFMQNKGLRLLRSPSAENKHAQSTGAPYNPLDTNGGKDANGRDKYFENFGYAWGAKKMPVSRNKRQTTNVTDQASISSYLKSDKTRAEWEAKNIRLVQVVTAQRGNGFGVYFQDHEGKLYPVTGDNYFAATNLTEDSPGFVDKSAYKASKGQAVKFYGIRGETRDQNVATLPTGSQFRLNGLDDPKPQFVSKGKGLGDDNKTEGMGRKSRYLLNIKNDGTLWWIPMTDTTKLRKNDSPQAHPLTEAQVDYLNPHKGAYYKLTNPDTNVYSWDTVDPDIRDQQQADYQEKTNMMNEMYDEISRKTGQEPKTGLNAYKWVIIGPAGTRGKNTGQGKTNATMFSPDNTFQDQSQNPTAKASSSQEAKMAQAVDTGGMPGTAAPPTFQSPGAGAPLEHLDSSGDYNGIGGADVHRKDWIRVSGEYNGDRVATLMAAGVNSKMPASQAMSGGNARTGEPSLRIALVKAFKQWNIKAPFPDDGEVNAAQMLFDKVVRGEQPAPGEDAPANNDPTGGLAAGDDAGTPDMAAGETGGNEQGMPAEPAIQQEAPVAPTPPVPPQSSMNLENTGIEHLPPGQEFPQNAGAPAKPGSLRVRYNNDWHTMAKNKGYLKTSNEVIRKLKGKG